MPQTCMYWLILLQIQVNVTFCYFIQITHYLKTNKKYQYIHEYIYIVHVVPNILHNNPPPPLLIEIFRKAEYRLRVFTNILARF
jgi:hypothetical protein